jgi:hypothetical protein
LSIPLLNQQIQTSNKTIMAAETHSPGPANALYGLGLIGAAVYFIGQAGTFWAGVIGFLKAVVWPAFLVYELFKYLYGLG